MQKFKQFTMVAVLMASLAPLSLPANAIIYSNPTPQSSGQAMQYGVLNFSATASKKVNNDQVTATMSKVIQNSNPIEVARQITQSLNHATAIAKKYPMVKVSTGSQSTYPQYDKNQKITGWTGNANLTLTSIDTVATSKLIAELQSDMNLNGLNFSVSDEVRKQAQQELMIEASKNFQRQAQALLPAWQARDYQLVNVTFDQANDYRPMPRAYGGMVMAKMASAVPEQNFEAGESTLTVTANGAVQLVK